VTAGWLRRQASSSAGATGGPEECVRAGLGGDDIRAYLNFDQLLDSILNPYVFMTARALPDDRFIPCPHESPLWKVRKCLFAGLLALQILKHDAGRLDAKLTWQIISYDHCST
jgi:hypothetical protein